MLNRIRAVALVVFLGLVPQAHALEIILNDVNPDGTDATALAAFKEAAMIWENILTDDVTVRIDVTFETLDPGVLGGTSRNFDDQILYSDYRAALIADATSVADATATASLTDTAMFNYAFRDLGSSDVFAFDGTVDFDINSKLDVNTATLKALGLLADDGVSSDAFIAFSDSFDFDFDPSDGITAGAFDFVGVAAHEIGHALGFISGVDFLDFFSGPLGQGFIDFGPFDVNDLVEVDFGIASPLDLFRYSEGSIDLGEFYGINPLRDLTLGNLGDVFFSLDGGATSLGTFSTGAFNGLGSGGGYQASHWEDDLGLGLMDPTAARGELLGLSGLDLTAFDVIGWDIRTVPEPGTLALFAVGLLALGAVQRRRRIVA